MPVITAHHFGVPAGIVKLITESVPTILCRFFLYFFYGCPCFWPASVPTFMISPIVDDNAENINF